MLARLADLEARGLLTPELVQLVGEEAKALGLRILPDAGGVRGRLPAPRRRLRLV